MHWHIGLWQSGPQIEFVTAVVPQDFWHWNCGGCTLVCTHCRGHFQILASVFSLPRYLKLPLFPHHNKKSVSKGRNMFREKKHQTKPTCNLKMFWSLPIYLLGFSKYECWVTDLIMPLLSFYFFRVVTCLFVSQAFISIWNVKNRSYD